VARKRRTSSQDLRGKVAVITGGSRGIGFAIAQALAQAGCELVISGRNARTLKAAESKLSSSRVLAQQCDVREPGSVESLFAVVRRQLKHLDILINNAGISHAIANTDKLPLQAWQDVIATNLTGMFLCTRAALPLMRDGGTIVNNLSIAATTVFAGQAAYCAAKHGALGFTRTLREEVRGRGIRVIALMAGATDTEIWNQFWPDAPRSRMLRPEAIADAVLSALLQPAGSTVEEITIMPTAGAL
jgi:NAD(P)-dependent dehydrogenase (short-subunit alcohol dehydrogenase family)